MENFYCVSTPSASPTSGFIFFFKKRREKTYLKVKPMSIDFRDTKKQRTKKKYCSWDYPMKMTQMVWQLIIETCVYKVQESKVAGYR